MSSGAWTPAAIAIDGDRVWRELDELARFSAVPAPAVTRIVFSNVDRRARDYVKALFREEFLDIREDAVGNTFARWAGTDVTLPAVASGSHIDAIPNAGRFDGTIGVLGAIEAVRALRRSGFRPRKSIEVILFTSEEPTRFGVGCLGSRLMSSGLDPDTVDGLKDRDGRTLADARAGAGFTGALSSVALGADAYAAFVELHIEQGPILEARGLDIGIVTAIAAPASLRVHIEGEGGHAGAVLMPERRDAFLAGAEVALAVEAAARGTGSIDTVGTVGVCDSVSRGHQQCPEPDDARRGCAGYRRWPARRRAGRDSTGVRRHRGTTSRVDRHRDDHCRRTLSMLAGRHRGGHRSGYGTRSGCRPADQPGVPRFAVHVPRGADRDDFHPLPRRRESQARRVRVAGSDQAWRRCAGRHARRAGGVDDGQHAETLHRVVKVNLGIVLHHVLSSHGDSKRTTSRPRRSFAVRTPEVVSANGFAVGDSGTGHRPATWGSGSSTERIPYPIAAALR